jgi:hypothetical protein
MLLGIITGILNLIPYVGILIAGILTILSSLTGSPDLSIILGVIGVNVVVQIIDNILCTGNYKHKGSNKRFRIHYRNYSRRRNWG